MMIEYQSPGIYFDPVAVDEAIQPVATATAGFVGYAPYAETDDGEWKFGAPAHTPVLVTSWIQFCEEFGDAEGSPYLPGCYLAHAVRGFFDNGGTRAYVVRVPLPPNFERGLKGQGLPVSNADIADLIGTPRADLPSDRRRGLAALAGVDEVCIVAVPDLMAGLWHRSRLRPDRQSRCPFCRGLLGGPVDRCFRCKRQGPEEVSEEVRDARLTAILAAQLAMVDYCEQARDRIAILDPIPGFSPAWTEAWVRSAEYPCARGHAAYFYPWIQVQDGMAGEDRMVPPSGHLAGLWARNDLERGVHRAPANLEIEGAFHLERVLTDGEQQQLYPHGINCLRAFPGRGICVWGARTLSSNPSWKYLNVRRLLTYVEKSIERDMQIAVFEPNTPDLWDRITRTISAFLTVQWRQGRLAGATPEQAFRVKCDAETNSEESVALGRIVTEVWVAPLKPSEFILFRLYQWHGAAQ